jgi:hypothetical protein
MLTLFLQNKERRLKNEAYKPTRPFASSSLPQLGRVKCEFFIHFDKNGGIHTDAI